MHRKGKQGQGFVRDPPDPERAFVRSEARFRATGQAPGPSIYKVQGQDP